MVINHTTAFLSVLLFMNYLWGCSTTTPYFYYAEELVDPELSIEPRPPSFNHLAHVKAPANRGYTVRVVTEQELLRVHDRDKDLTLSRCWEILARLNNRASYYISHDVHDGRPLKVPDDFSAFKGWTPLPRHIPDITAVSKLILIIKDIPFLGWYENGKLVGDSLVCIGKTDELTEAGIYRVRDKDVDHISRSYNNAFGAPSPMPYGLRIYGNVWIHGGDIANGYCSHGCINLPLLNAERLFQWSNLGTAALVVNSLGELNRVLAENHSNCSLFAHQCALRRTGVN
jgi:hypothetical protein